MRFVVKPEGDKTPKLASQDTYKKLLSIAQIIDKDAISDSIYRESYDTPDGKRSKVEDQLALTYLNKCGYCERICKADIEHYRPKKKVHGLSSHNGYYWLCYEWTNLLPACVTCNRDGAKHTKFTVYGNRVTRPSFTNSTKTDLDLTASKANNSPLKDEIPGLLHPEVDDPEAYFEFEVISVSDGIRLKAKANTTTNPNIQNRATDTINICKLNRQELRFDRYTNVVLSFVSAAENTFNTYDGTSLVDELIKLINQLKYNSTKDKFNHTLLRKYIITSRDNFENIVLPFCEQKMRRTLLTAYDIA